MADRVGKKRRRMRKVLTAAVCVLILAALLVHFSVQAFSRRLRADLVSSLERLGLASSYGDISFDVTGRRAQLRGLVLVSKDGSLRCSVDEVNVGFFYVPLLENVMILDAELVRPDIEIHADKSHPVPASLPAGLASGAGQGRSTNIILKALQVTDAKVKVIHPAISKVLAWETLEYRANGTLSFSHLSADAHFAGSNTAHGAFEILLAVPDRPGMPVRISFEAESDSAMTTLEVSSLEADVPSLGLSLRARGALPLAGKDTETRLWGSAVFEYAMLAPLLSPGATDLLGDAVKSLDGPVRVEDIRIEYGGATLQCSGAVDLTDAAFDVPISLHPAEDAGGEESSVADSLSITKEAGRRLVVESNLDVTQEAVSFLSNVEADGLKLAVEALSEAVFSGHAGLVLSAKRAPDALIDETSLKAECTFTDLRFINETLDGSVTGALVLSGDGLATSGLTINCSQGQVTVIGEAHRDGERILADLLISVPTLDLRRMKKDPQTAEGAAPSSAPAVRTVNWDALRTTARALEVNANVLIGNVFHRDVTIEAASGQWKLRDGKLTAHKLRGRACRGLFTLDGTSLDFKQIPPECHVVYNFADMRPEPLLERFVKFLFFQLNFAGEFSAGGYQYFHLYSTSGEEGLQKFWSSFNGSGWWETTLGYLEGQGAPDYVATLIPSLNLMRYPFNKMHADVEMVKGKTESRMQFETDRTDIDVDGWTDTKGDFNYDLYLSLAERGGGNRGRVRILGYTGKVNRDGTPARLEVEYASEQSLKKALSRYVVDPVKRILVPTWLLKSKEEEDAPEGEE